jgi:hypothetical protein
LTTKQLDFEDGAKFCYRKLALALLTFDNAIHATFDSMNFAAHPRKSNLLRILPTASWPLPRVIKGKQG